MEKCLKWKNRGSKLWEAELREQWTSLLQSRLAERLFVWLWSSAKPLSYSWNPWTLAHPTRKCQNHRQQCSQRCWPCMLGTTQITYYFSVHYLQSQSCSIDTGPLCICLPALSLNPLTAPPPTPPLFSTEHIWRWASTSAEEYQCVNGSLFPLRLSLWFSFGQKRLLAWGDVCRPHENLCLSFLKRPHCTDSQLILRLRYPVWNHLGMTEHPLAVETFSDWLGLCASWT